MSWDILPARPKPQPTEDSDDDNGCLPILIGVVACCLFIWGAQIVQRQGRRLEVLEAKVAALTLAGSKR